MEDKGNRISKSNNRTGEYQDGKRGGEGYSRLANSEKS